MTGANMWLIAVLVLLLCLIPCGIVIVKAPTMDRLVALEMAGVVCVLILLLLAQGLNRSSFYDLALAFALLDFPASIVFAHFLERWL